MSPLLSVQLELEVQDCPFYKHPLSLFGSCSKFSFYNDSDKNGGTCHLWFTYNLTQKPLSTTKFISSHFYLSSFFNQNFSIH